MSLFQVSLETQYTLGGSLERVPGTTFAEVYNVIDPSGVLSKSAYNAWCIDSTVRLAPAVSLDFNIYSSDELSNGLDSTAITSYTGKAWDGSEENFDLINWLLNQGYQGNDSSAIPGSSTSGIVTVSDMQAAIWMLLEQPIETGSLDLNTYDINRANAIVAAARANGEGFVADATQVQGIVTVDAYGGTFFQPLFLVDQAAQLGDYIWFDANQDGIQDEDEVGIQGMTVKLLRDLNGDGTIAVDEIVATTITDATGYYDFKGLVGGVEYQVLFDMPSSTDLSITLNGETFIVADGNSFSLSQANVGNDLLDSDATQVFDPNTFATNILSQTVTLEAGQFDQSIDAGFWAEGVGTPPTAGLGNYVWNDANRNGIQDSSEMGIAGATVSVLDGGTVIATTTTDANGYYEFQDLIAGIEYQVSFDISDVTGSRSFTLTAANQGTNDALDSDATIVNGIAITSGIILEGGTFNDTIDTGFYDSSAGLSAPGTGTPGFWHKQGLPFYDGIIGNESKAGKSGFADGELLTPGATGILVGDFNRNGITDNGENTVFFNFDEAETLINSKNHKKTDLLGGEKDTLMLGRATVASWLNYLAGNSVDLASGAKDIADYLDNAVTLLGAYQSNDSGLINQVSSALGVSVNGVATILDNYNNGSSQFATGNFSRG